MNYGISLLHEGVQLLLIPTLVLLGVFFLYSLIEFATCLWEGVRRKSGLNDEIERLRNHTNSKEA